jgi:hypothetical protein
MKRLVIALCIVISTSALAQDSVVVKEKKVKKEKVVDTTPAPQILNKKGHAILPEARDWSIGFDANFIIDYLGNMFNNSNPNPGGRPGWLSPNTIIVKYMKRDRLAYLGAVRIGNVATKINSPIPDQSSTVTPSFTTTDTWKNDSMNIQLGIGFQKYRGKGRLQGIYGATFQVLYGRMTDKYTYGNVIDETHPVNGDTSSVDQNTTNFGTGITGVDNVMEGGTVRVTESKSGALFGAGVRGFLGIEYFFAAKMSLGAQYGWGINFVSLGEGEVTAETLDANGDKLSATVKGADASSFYIDTDNGGGQISLNFYF